jgi:hypothetical protein
MSKEEKYGIRSLHYSTRHRHFYGACPMLDIDHIEFCGKEPVLLYDEKHGNINEIEIDSYSASCYRTISQRLKVPFLLVVVFAMRQLEKDLNYTLLSANHTVAGNSQYSNDHYQFYAIPGNQYAPGLGGQYTELAWVSMLHDIRKQKLPENIKKNLCTTWKPVKLPKIVCNKKIIAYEKSKLHIA